MKTTIKLAVIKLVLINISLFSIVFINACKKETTNNPSIQIDSISDIDGNVYKTVKIGKQWWMAENLKVKRYRNGDTLIFVDTQFDPGKVKWDTINTGSYTNTNAIFGLFYNWYAIIDNRNIAPAGWHVPSDDEWKELEMFLGMSKEDADKVNFRGNKEGDKLKSINDQGWNKPSDIYKVWGTNESGFCAKGGGAVMNNKIWGNPSSYLTGFWWTSTVKVDSLAWYRYLDYNKANVFRFYGSKNYGFSVRCVKD